MGVVSSIEKLKREIAYKKLIFIDGNVQDIYHHDGQFLSLNGYLVKELKQAKLFDDIFVWDRIEGLTDGDAAHLQTPQAASVPVDKQVQGLDVNLFDETGQTSGQYKRPVDFFPIVYKNLLNEKRKVCFIINYSNYLFPNEQGLSDCDREDLTRLSRGIRDQKVQISGDGSAVIFITSNIAQIPVSIYQNNPDSKLITLGKPDRDERKEIVDSISPQFKLKTGLESDEQGKINLIDGMDNFTTKEIIQIAHLSRTADDSMTVDKLLSLYKYGKKDSPWEQLEPKKVRQIAEILRKRVKGQEPAIEKVREVVIRAKTGLSGLQHSKSKSKPKGVLFFSGPTGVGKTELAKSLAEFLFNDEGACIRFDMSEYNHEHSDQKLIGAPPGYVGYEAGGQLTNLIKEHPFCVLLFDEIEKAHAKILDKFLQILEDGRLTDNKGETVYFSECIIIFTSNIGANLVSVTMNYDDIRQTIFGSIKDKFENEINRPELLGRIGYGNIITFDFIRDKKMQKAIAQTKIAPIVEYIKESRNINLVFSNEEEFLEYVVSKADASKGGRDILNKLEDILVSKLADFLFENDGYIYPGSTVPVHFDNKTKALQFGD
ncbi:MAG: AAA family ATPase [Treponema sp.]|jgi:ATP-dependent Clp protease ATP-binding subunit ClpA|nr:AAA family ATPase [Treponema sp.]